MTDTSVDLNIKLYITDNDRVCILADCFMYSHYWCSGVEVYKDGKHIGYNEERINDPGVVFKYRDGDSNIEYSLTSDMLDEGIRRAVAEGYDCVPITQREGETRLNFDEMDAIGADVILQMALFGRVIYG